MVKPRDIARNTEEEEECVLVACLTSQQHTSVSQGRICAGDFTCWHTEIEVADPTFYLTQSQYTDNGPTSPSAGPVMPGAGLGSHWSANFEVTGNRTAAYYQICMLDPEKSRRKLDSNPGSSAPEADALTTRPTRRSNKKRKKYTNKHIEKTAIPRQVNKLSVQAGDLRSEPFANSLLWCCFCLLSFLFNPTTHVYT